ncbi:TPA: poly-beta-1,6-N-acetyl-D-glucosamine biosynthesis protein PgaD [Escherichia coli]|nr:poly-beta-1,6-N-acetyl-D-glucosamine biosynthesis protein PgaD [Escherichia coli]
MNNLIITTRQSPVRLLVDYVATTILWTLFALFIFLFAMDLLTGYYWQSEARSRLQFYFLLAVANAVVLIVWALYNKLRFQKQQHHAAYQYTPQEYAESLAIPDELYQQLQKSHRMSVHFTSQGQIKMVVSEKALFRA